MTPTIHPTRARRLNDWPEPMNLWKWCARRCHRPDGTQASLAEFRALAVRKALRGADEGYKAYLARALYEEASRVIATMPAGRVPEWVTDLMMERWQRAHAEEIELRELESSLAWRG